MTHGICGLGCWKLLADLDPNTQSWKMYGDICLWGELPSLQTLPVSGTTQNGLLFEHRTLEPLTDANEFSLLPTPAARDGKDLSKTTAYLAQRKRHSPSMATVALEHGCKWFEIGDVYEASMGFPLGWSDLGSKDAETQSSRRSRK